MTMTFTRTPPKQKAKKIAREIKKENPDYNYISDLFRHIRLELDIPKEQKPKKLPYVPTEEEIHRFYKAVWDAKNMKHMLIIKTLIYTGARVSELINIKIEDVDFDQCQIRINQGKGKKDRIVPFPVEFKEVLAMHMQNMKEKGAKHLFESSWKRAYTDRGIRKVLESYTKAAGIEHSISPHKLRHFLFTWLKRKGIGDAFIQPYSGHESRQSLEVYSKLSLKDAQREYAEAMKEFPI